MARHVPVFCIAKHTHMHARVLYRHKRPPPGCNRTRYSSECTATLCCGYCSCGSQINGLEGFAVLYSSHLLQLEFGPAGGNYDTQTCSSVLFDPHNSCRYTARKHSSLLVPPPGLHCTLFCFRINDVRGYPCATSGNHTKAPLLLPVSVSPPPHPALFCQQGRGLPRRRKKQRRLRQNPKTTHNKAQHQRQRRLLLLLIPRLSPRRRSSLPLRRRSWWRFPMSRPLLPLVLWAENRKKTLRCPSNPKMTLCLPLAPLKSPSRLRPSLRVARLRPHPLRLRLQAVSEGIPASPPNVSRTRPGSPDVGWGINGFHVKSDAPARRFRVCSLCKSTRHVFVPCFLRRGGGFCVDELDRAHRNASPNDQPSSTGLPPFTLFQSWNSLSSLSC